MVGEQTSKMSWQLPSLVESIQRRVMMSLAASLVFLVLIALGWAVWAVVLDLVGGITKPSIERFKSVTLEILTVFIFMEIFTLLMEYLRTQRVRLTNLVDATLAVLLRELWVQLYGEHASFEFLLRLAGVTVALILLRVASVRYSPNEIYSEPARAATRPEGQAGGLAASGAK